MNILLQDLRFGFRSLLRQPLFTGAAVLVLALGIGANIAMFSVINAVLLQPLPYPKPDRLAFIREYQTALRTIAVSYPNYLDWRAAQRSFTDLAVERSENFDVSFQAAGIIVPEQVEAAQVSASFLSVLDVRPELGRDFLPSDDIPGAAPVALISDRLWRQRFAADPAVVGRSLKVEGTSRQIIGVLPAFVDVPKKTDLFVPIADLQKNADIQERSAHPGFSVIGRLRPGVTLEQARAELNSIARELERRYPDSNTGSRVDVKTLLEARVGQFRANLYLLLAAVMCVLGIACANVANLQLARGVARQKELAVRAALGASRWRLVRQLLTEGMLLGVGGGLLAVLLALWAVDAIVKLTPPEVSRFHQIRIDPLILGFSALIALGTGLLVGAWPAWRMSSTKAMARSLHQGNTRGSTGGFAQQRMRSVLVVAQVALAVVLLAGAGLTLKSFYRSQTEPLGFEPDHLLVLSVSLPTARYDKPKRDQFVENLLTKVRSFSGVSSAAIAMNIPFDNNNWAQGFHVTGAPPDEKGMQPTAEVTFTSPGYFQTLGISMRQGRDFGPQEAASLTKSVIIDAELARLYFPGQDPVGKYIDDEDTPPGEAPKPMLIVGVVPHSRNEAPGDTNHVVGRVQMYLCNTQSEVPVSTLVVRVSSGDPLRLVKQVQAAVHSLDDEVPVAQVSTMETNIANSLSSQRLTMVLLAAFAVLALVLASVGLYGVMALNVTQRTRELGIRLALGAQRWAVLGLILRQGITLVGIGLMAGIVVALLSGRVLAGILYGVGGNDPATLGIVVFVLGVAALLACLLPAQRATRVDPMVALRSE